MCGAETEGVSIDSTEFTFAPGPRIPGGTYEWDIGTAGSTTMLAFGILPLASLAEGPTRAIVHGGVFQDYAPSPYHLQHVLGAVLRRIGVVMSLQVRRPGYVPGGAGIIELNVTPNSELAPLTLNDPGIVGQVHGTAISSHLADRRVSERMACSCEDHLSQAGLRCAIERIEDTTACHAGANLAIWAESTTGCRLGADRAGAFGRTSEAIGRFVATSFLDDVESGATTDRHLADQLVLFAALAAGSSHYTVPRESEHLATNLWLIGQFGAVGTVDHNRVVIEGIGLARSREVEQALATSRLTAGTRRAAGAATGGHPDMWPGAGRDWT